MSEPKIYTKCLRCNRKLKTEKAKLRGYGDYCWRVHKQEEKSKTKTIFQILQNISE